MIDIVDQTINIWRTTQFCWGKDDCILSLANYVSILTGIDYAKDWRGKYSTEEQAKEIINKLGGIENIITSCGFEETNILERGNIVLVNGTGGLFTGDTIAFRMMRGCVEIRYSLLDIDHIWKVS